MLQRVYQVAYDMPCFGLWLGLRLSYEWIESECPRRGWLCHCTERLHKLPGASCIPIVHERPWICFHTPLITRVFSMIAVVGARHFSNIYSRKCAATVKSDVSRGIPGVFKFGSNALQSLVRLELEVRIYQAWSMVETSRLRKAKTTRSQYFNP